MARLKKKSDEKHSLMIRYDSVQEVIILETLKPERFTRYGFGTFLENIDPKEILISESALEALLECPARSGLQGMEFWPENRLAWGTYGSIFTTIPYDAINCPNGAKKWLRKCDTYRNDFSSSKPLITTK